MSIENDDKPKTPNEKPVQSSKKIHQTHFSVPEKIVDDTKYDTEYEWIPSGPGRMKRVLKKNPPQK